MEDILDRGVCILIVITSRCLKQHPALYEAKVGGADGPVATAL
jgi:hypothetical protein